MGLGGATTSAQHLSYLWDDIRSQIGIQIRVLNSIAELSADLPLLLYDDNVGSGGQGSTVLMQWLGVDKERWFVTEEHVDRLEHDIVSKLKGCELSICFITGRRAGLRTVLTTAEELLGRKPVGLVVAPTDLSCFDAASRLYETKEDAERASSVFANAGKKALHDRLPDKSTEWIEENKLGYGNSAGLTVFHYNTPTTTLTALWKDCTVAGNRWTALFPRRPRLQ
jgi:hypothetical protein